MRPCTRNIGVAGSTTKRGCSGWRGGRAKAPVSDSDLPRQVGHRALGDERAAAFAGAGADVDDVVGAADRVLVVFDDDERVARLVAERLQRHQTEDLVVARMQPDRRLVVADAFRRLFAELRRRADALRRLAASVGAARRASGSQADFAEELGRRDLGDHVARDAALARSERPLALRAWRSSARHRQPTRRRRR